MSDRIDELVETVRTACEVIDDEGSTPSRPCTVYGDALTELAAYIERLEAERDALLAEHEAVGMAASEGLLHYATVMKLTHAIAERVIHGE